MAVANLDDTFPYRSYRDYVSALSVTDSAYQRLASFLASSPDALKTSHIHGETQVPRTGSVVVLDRVGDRLDSQHFPISEDSTEKDIAIFVDALDERPPASKTRIVLISYHRDSITGEYTGINTNILNTVGWKYRVHPEILMWHFGSDYGLDRRFFPSAAPPLPSPLSSRQFCHLRNGKSLFSTFLHKESRVVNANTGTLESSSRSLNGDAMTNGQSSNHFRKKSSIPRLGFTCITPEFS